MNKETKEQLTIILNTMDVPKNRTNLDDPSSISWLNRNLFVRNFSHPQFMDAIKLIKKLLGIHI